MPTAYSYVRFSAKIQAKGDSLRRQTELSEAYAKAHGLTLDHTLRLKDLGVSAYKSDNNNTTKALGGFIEAIKSGRVKAGDYLLIEGLDRLSRQTINIAMQRFLEIVNSGVIVVTLQDERVFNANKGGLDISDMMISLIEMARANSESEAKSKRLTAVWQAKKTKARSGGIAFHRCPKWLKWNGEKYIIIPEAAKSVRAIFELAANGFGYKAIQKYANNADNGIKPIGTCGEWSESSINKLLNTKTAIGFWHTRKEEIANYYPPVVSKDLWLRARASLERRKSKSGRVGDKCTNIFGGILKVTKTVLPIVGKERITKDNTCSARIVNKANRKYITPSNAVRGIGDWQYIGILYNEVERAILFWIQELDIESVFSETTTKDREKLEAISEELIVVSATLDGIVEQLISGSAAKALNQAAKKLEEKKAKLTAEVESMLAAIKSPMSEVATDLVSLIEKVQSGDIVARMKMRDRIRQIVTGIYMNIGTTGKGHIHERFATIRIELVNGEHDNLIVNTDGLGGVTTMYAGRLTKADSTGKVGDTIGFIVDGNLKDGKVINLTEFDKGN